MTIFIANEKPKEYFNHIIFFFISLCLILNPVSSQSIELSFSNRNVNLKKNREFAKFDKYTKKNEITNELNSPNFPNSPDFPDLSQNILNYFSFLQSPSFDLPLMVDDLDTPIVDLCLGTPPQCFKVLIDTGSLFLWVADIYSYKYDTLDPLTKFDYNKSSTFLNLSQNLRIDYANGLAEGVLVKDTFSYGKTNSSDFTFLLARREIGHAGIDGILGMGYNYFAYDNSSFGTISLLEKLHSENLIKREIFTMKFKDEKTGSIIIGDLPEEISSDLSNYGNCPLIKTTEGKNNSHWICELTLLNYGENETDSIMVKQNAVIDTSTNFIFAPYEFLEKLFQNYFDKNTEKGQCSLSTSKSNKSRIRCNKSLNMLNLPGLYFVFGEWALMMKPGEMFFKNSDSTVTFFIKSSSTSSNEWVIGQPFLKKFQVVFDRENHVVGFYQKYDSMKYTGHLPQPPREKEPFSDWITIFLIFGVMLIVPILIWLGMYLKRKRNEDLLLDGRYPLFRSSTSSTSTNFINN